MKLVVHGHQLGVPRGAQTFLRKHLVEPLARLHDSPAHELVVGFDSARPRKGGVRQQCRVTLHIPGARTVTVQSTSEDVHAAIMDAGHRLRRLLEREVAKQRRTVRSPMHKPLGRAWRAQATRAGVTPDGTPSTL